MIKTGKTEYDERLELSQRITEQFIEARYQNVPGKLDGGQNHEKCYGELQVKGTASDTDGQRNLRTLFLH
jgi:hypothetical protein